MSETLFEIAGIHVTITGAGVAVSLLVMILFEALWLTDRKKKTGVPIFAGQVMNGIGFGLLPALAVLKAFTEMNEGAGVRVFEPLPMVRWVTEAGFFRCARTESAAAVLCFLLVCLWLIFRKNELPDNGDLLMIAVCIWADIRLITENLRSNPADLFRYASCAVMIACIVIWSVRRMKKQYSPGRTALDLMAAGICIAINLVTAKAVMTTGSEIGDFAVKTGSALLLLMLVLMTGGDLRRSLEKDMKG